MRITFKTVNEHAQGVLSRRYSDLSRIQEQLSTGKRLMRPSDDPVDAANDLKLRTKGVQITQFHENVNDGMAFMSVSDTAMISMNDLLQRARELGIQGATDTLSADQRSFILKEVDQLFRQMLNLGNTTFKGQYVFGGTQTTIMPFPVDKSVATDTLDYQGLRMAYFDASAPGPAQIRNAFNDEPITNIMPGTFKLQRGATQYVEGTDFTLDYVTGQITAINPALAVDMSEGGQFTAGPNGYYSPTGFQMTFEYVGRGHDVYGDPVVSDGEILRQTEQGVSIAINVSAEELRRDPATGLDMVETFVRFEERLMRSDTVGIDQSIDEIDTAFKTILSAQSKNGARMNRFEITLGRNELQDTENTRLQSDLEDADFAETASKFSLMETVYNAALKSAANVIKNSLVDFL